MSQHPNIHPNFATVNELLNWSANHEDQWVQKLGDMLFKLFTETDSVSDSDLLTNYHEKDAIIADLENTVKMVQRDNDDLEEQLNEAKTNINSLKYRLDQDERQKLLTHLESELFLAKEHNSTLHKRVLALIDENTKLSNKLKMWNALSTE